MISNILSISVISHSNRRSILGSQGAKQSGAVLIVSLIILLVMTLIGVTNMQSSGFQQKMANNAQARQEALQVAESTLSLIENGLIRQFKTNSQLNPFVQDCASGNPNCYDDNCTGGLCFNGIYTNFHEPKDCRLTGNLVDSKFLDEALWQDGSGRHLVANNIVNGANSQKFDDPKYIIEFLCFIPRGSSRTCKPSDSSSNGCAPIFRTTTFVERKGIESRVMMQSILQLTDI